MKQKLVRGVGINDANYQVCHYENRKQIMCPFYKAWSNMLTRCYYVPNGRSSPLYIGCAVCEEWLTFSNFKAWMEKQDWQGKHLDKDLLIVGNKVYSPEACAFVDPSINAFVLDNRINRGNNPTGVSWYPRYQKFMATCSNPFTKKYQTLGYFDTADDAHKAWKSKKLEHAKALSKTILDRRVAEAIIKRYS